MPMGFRWRRRQAASVRSGHPGFRRYCGPAPRCPFRLAKRSSASAICRGEASSATCRLARRPAGHPREGRNGPDTFLPSRYPLKAWPICPFPLREDQAFFRRAPNGGSRPVQPVGRPPVTSATGRGENGGRDIPACCGLRARTLPPVGHPSTWRSTVWRNPSANRRGALGLPRTGRLTLDILTFLSRPNPRPVGRCCRHGGHRRCRPTMVAGG